MTDKGGGTRPPPLCAVRQRSANGTVNSGHGGFEPHPAHRFFQNTTERRGHLATKTKEAQTPAAYTRAVDKLRDEMAKADGQLRYLGEGMTVLLQLRPECEAAILAQGKTLSGALSAIRSAAKGGVADPIASTTAICGYYGIPCPDPRALALEINRGMMGEVRGEDEGKGKREKGKGMAGEYEADADATADLFDLDALMGGI